MFIYDRRSYRIYETGLTEQDIKDDRLFIGGENRIVIGVYRTKRGTQVELDK